LVFEGHAFFPQRKIAMGRHQQTNKNGGKGFWQIPNLVSEGVYNPPGKLT